MIKLTRIRNADGPLSKSLSLEGGKLIKTAAADLVRGRGETVSVASIRDLNELVGGLSSTEALTFGVTKHEECVITTQKRQRHDPYAPLNMVCRDRAHFNWPSGPGVLMLDIDRPKDGTASLKAKTFDAMMANLLPWWEPCARFYRPSVSAFIYDADGNELSGAGSLRCYLIADIAANIPFVGVAITDALWKAGLGRIEFSAAGSMLVRCPVDGAVWQPERLDFAGPAVLGPGLTQRKHGSLVIDGDMIDTEWAVSSGPGKIDFPRWRANSMEVYEARCRARPEEKRRIERHVEELVAKDVAAGMDEKQARARRVSAVRGKVLLSNDMIIFRDKGSVSVADILRDPRAFDHQRCADPVEPEYGQDNRIAQFYANTRQYGSETVHRPHIFSHAHGGLVYRLEA